MKQNSEIILYQSSDNTTEVEVKFDGDTVWLNRQQLALLEQIDSDKTFNPTSIIAFGYHFESKNLCELAENVKSYTNKKNIDIDFVTRY